MTLGESSSTFIRWDHVPELKAPFMVVGFYGWSDAGNVSSDTLAYLVEQLEFRVFAAFPNEPFLNYTMDRPMGKVEQGLLRYMEPAVMEFACATSSEAEHDLAVLLGKEPSLNWQLFAETVLGVIRELGVQRLYTVGGVQDTIPHSAPPRISVVGSSASALASVMEMEPEIQPAEYFGPVSIHSRLIQTCADNGIEAVSLWGHVPAYLQKSPRTVAKVVRLLCRLSGFGCPVDSLIRRSIEMDRRINEILAKDAGLKQFVETIEGRAGSGVPHSLGDKIIRLNDFLRRDSPKEPQSP